VWNHAARVDGTVEDNTPNADAAVPDQFDLILQAEVGGILGNSGANYTLTFTARYRIAIPPAWPAPSITTSAWSARTSR
jgi:hypothetical protein